MIIGNLKQVRGVGAMQFEKIKRGLGGPSQVQFKKVTALRLNYRGIESQFLTGQKEVPIYLMMSSTTSDILLNNQIHYFW